MSPKFTTGLVMKRHKPQDSIHKKKQNTNKCESVVAMVYREPTMYDVLLASLDTSNKVAADMNTRRQRQEDGVRDTERDEDENSDSKDEDLSSAYAKDDEIQGDDQETYDDSQRDSEDCESDDEDELSTNGQSSVASCSSTSALSEHLGHKLSSEQVETLSKCNWNFKWEAPAIGMPNCSWKGTRQNFLDDADQSDATYGLKPKLLKHWLKLYKKSGGKDFDSSNRRRFFSICNSYMDILHSNKRPFYNQGGSGEDSSYMDAYLMHSLNHIFRSRDLVQKNDRIISKLSEEEVLSNDRFMDQGYTRPKVLILLPYRSIAYRVVMRLIQLTPESQRVHVERLDKFKEEFGCCDDDDDDDVETSRNEKSEKPYDWKALFGEGINHDDAFLLGVKHTRKTIELYGDFYSSDIIVASPLGLLLAMGKAEEDKERDVDYLSSIEVLVIDHADVMSMQSWYNVDNVVNKLNSVPLKQHGTNVMRIRSLYLDGHARFYRQSIILGCYLTTEINFLFNHQCLNYKGKMKLECGYKGVLQEVLCSAIQVYERFDSVSTLQAYYARLDFFTKKVFPKIRDSVQGGVMIFINNSAIELGMLKRFLKSQNTSFCSLDEYARPEEKSRARQSFFDGSTKIMLYTERSYFFWRYKVRGIKKLIFYSLPERKEFYPQILNMLEESHDMMSIVLYTRCDQFPLERIIGSASAKKLFSSEKSMFTYC